MQPRTRSIPTILEWAAREDAKERQIIIEEERSAEGGQATLKQLTDTKLIEKAKIAIEAIHEELWGPNIIKAVKKLPRGDILYEMDSSKLGEKLRNKEVGEKFLTNYSSLVAI